MHAEPITFGLKLPNWYSEMLRNIDALRDWRPSRCGVGKLSGAVGNAATSSRSTKRGFASALG